MCPSNNIYENSYNVILLELEIIFTNCNNNLCTMKVILWSWFQNTLSSITWTPESVSEGLQSISDIDLLCIIKYINYMYTIFFFPKYIWVDYFFFPIFILKSVWVQRASLVAQTEKSPPTQCRRPRFDP